MADWTAYDYDEQRWLTVALRGASTSAPRLASDTRTQDGLTVARAELDRLEAAFPHRDGRTVSEIVRVDSRRWKRLRGQYHRDTRAIHIIGWLFDDRCRDDLIDVLRHEYAHHLAGVDAGHGRAFKLEARRVGTTRTKARDAMLNPDGCNAARADWEQR